MNELLLNYIVQAILGGASGYITNDYAINMLFKEYTPLKLGGVIKKTRIEFIENISSMVENDIVNKEILHEILNSDEFKTKFEKLTDDFYTSCLYQTVGKDKFSDIDGFDQTLSEVDKYVKEIINEHLESLLNLIADNFDISYYLTELQSKKLADSVYLSIKDVFENTETVENALVYLYENNKGLKLSDILDTDTNMAAINELVNKFVDIATDNVIDSKISKLSGINEAFAEALSVFYNKQIKNIINIDGEKVNSFILSMISNDNNAVYKICQSLFSYLKGLNKSIYSFLDPALKNNLKKYIEQNLPYITDSLVSYVQKNSMIIDRIIEDSVDEVIKESEGLRAKLLATVKNTYFQNVSKKYSIVDKIIVFIRKSSHPEKLSISISNAIIERLDNITVADIIKEAENNNFSADKAYDKVVAFINKNGNAIISSSEQYISKLRVSDILPTVNLNVEKLLSSPSLHDLLKNKSAAYIKYMLSKEISSLISEQKFADKTADYLKIKFNQNEKSIKNLITKTIRNINIDKNKLTEPLVTDFIKKESYDKYKEESSKLKSVNLTVVIDKLNSIENISKNSSETLRKFMVNNTDTILKGSIKGVVSNNLNKLSDEELITFANDFIGRELKPIMFFGGILGIIAGVILAAFQNSPVNPNEINIANMLTYAFVGYITNVVAINMIFKPYKEIKIISKIPFFRNFSMGYILKNQKSFAASTAHYIDSSLLSKKSINELFEKHKNSIKNSFVNSMVENNYQTLSNLLFKNMESTIRGIYGFLKKKIIKNIYVFSIFLHERISKINISSLITDKSIKYLSNFVLKNIINTNDLSNKIHKLIKSEKELKTEISDEYLVNLLNIEIIGTYDKGIELTEPDNFKKEILKHNNKYLEYTNRSMNIDDKKLLIVSNKISGFILSQNFKHNVSLSAISLFNKLFDRNKTFEELFDGKIKIYIDKNLPHILMNMTDKIKKSLAESKKPISISLQAELKSQLGFIERGMFSFMGGDEIIEEILNKILTQKLPKFMDVRKDEFNTIITDIINEKFYKTHVEVLYAKLDSLQINKIVENYFNLNSKRIEYKTNRIIIELYNKSKNNVDSILKLFNLEDLNSILNSYEAEINVFAKILHTSLTLNKNEMLKEASTVINTSANDFMNIKFSDIFNNVSKDDIDRILNNTIQVLNKDDNLENIIKSSLEAYKEYNTNVCLDNFLDKDEFVNSTKKFVNKLLMNDETEEITKNILRSVLENATSSNFNFIDSKSKEYIVNIFVDSSIESLKINLDEILKSVEFDKIAAEEIEKMEPEKIHQMFNSFGEKYFRRLMLYGFGGFVFGINMYVGFGLTGLKAISEAFKKDR